MRKEGRSAHGRCTSINLGESGKKDPYRVAVRVLEGDRVVHLCAGAQSGAPHAGGGGECGGSAEESEEHSDDLHDSLCDFRDLRGWVQAQGIRVMEDSRIDHLHM